MIKKIMKNGNVHIPQVYRERLSSDEVEVKIMEIEVEPGVVKTCVVLEPVKIDKKAITIYK